MNRRSLILSLVLAMTGLVLLSGCAADAAASKPARARNVILFVGDGMGIATVTAARILDGQQRGGSGEENVLSFERFPSTALSKTYTVDFQVGESAGTITAMMSGVKTAQRRARRGSRRHARPL